MAKLTWSGSEQYWDNGIKDAPPVTLDMDMKEADFSNKHLGVSGTIILTAFIKRNSFQDNGALSNLHVGQNSIPEEQMKAIIKMDKFDVLCAVPVKELKADSLKELDLSGQCLGAEGALVLSTCLHDNGALASLDISNNELTKGKLKPGMSGNFDSNYETDMSGVIALAEALNK